MKLAIVSNVAAPYRSELFDMVQRDIRDTTVFFQAIEEPDRSWPARPSLPYSHSYLRGVTLPFGRRKLLFHPQLGRQLRSLKADVVVAYGFGTATFQCARYARSKRKVLMLANDGTMETDPTQGPEAGYRRRLVARASGFIAASERAAEYFEALGADRKRISVVNLTRNLREARAQADEVRTTAAPASREHTVCIVARLVPGKRILDACKAILRVAQDLPRTRLLIAGDGPLRGEMTSWICENGQGRIQILGLLSWGELIRLYASCDAMIFPAKGEKFGMVMLESLACGLPVVAYDNAGAARELIRHGVNGYLAPDGDWVRLAQSLKELLADRVKHERMRDEARRIVETHDITVQSRRFIRAVQSAQEEGLIPT